MSNLFHFTFLCCLLTSVINCELLVVQEPSMNGKDQLKNLLLVGSNVLVGSESFLYQLDSENLTTKNMLNISGLNRLLLQIEDEGVNVLSCQPRSCILVNSSNILMMKNVNGPSNFANAEETLFFETTTDDTTDLTAILGADDTFIVAREVLNTNAVDIPSAISRISYDNTTDALDLSLVGKQTEASLFIKRKFITIFRSNKFVYFVFNLENFDSPNNLRFVKLCISDAGTGDGDLSTYTEVELQCGDDLSSDMITSATEITIDNHLMVLVSLRSESSSSSHICIFNVTEIDTIMDDTLQQCANGDMNLEINNLDRAGFNAGGTQCQAVIGITVTPCFRPGVTKFPLGITTPVIGRNILTSSTLQLFTSLVSFTYEGITYVFAGVGTNVEQYYYNNNTLQFIRSVNVTGSNDRVVDELHISNDYKYFYALSISSVSRYPINACNQYSCTSCVQSSMDPLCGGWCTLTSSCTKLTDCTTTPQIWKTTDDGCPVITNVEPDFLFTNDLNEANVNFTLTYNNIPNVTYDCVYEFDNGLMPVTTSANIISNNTLICPPPTMDQLQPFGENHTLSALLSLRTFPSSITINTYSGLEFTNCSTQLFCFSCLSSAGRCQWCPVSLKCISSYQCDGENEIPFNGSVPQDQCPFLVASTISSPTTSVSMTIFTANTVPPTSSHSFSTATLNLIIVGVSMGVFSTCTILVSVIAICFIYRHKHKQSLSSRHTMNDTTLTKDLHHDDDYVEKMELLSTIPTSSSSNHDDSQSLPKTLSRCLIKSSDMKLIEKVGQGEFGVVYRGLLTKYENNEPKMITVAVKTLKRAFSHSAQTEKLIEEAEKMIHFDHLNVLSLTGVCIGVLESPCIVMPFMSNGSLLSYLRKEAADLTVSALSDENVRLDTTKQLLSMCLQVAKGMTYLTKNKFVHRDLAARNCMISADGVIKVADFGLAEDVYTTEYFKQDRSSDESVKLPLKWMALESIHYGKFSEKSDVWSFGVLCWEVFSVGKSPYPGMSPLEVVKMLDSGERLDKPSNAACYDKSYSLILTCWEQSPDKRPHFFELVESIEKLLGPLADYMDFTSYFAKKLSS